MADFLRQFISHNRMLEGGFVIEDRLVTLADIECPILSAVGMVDQIAPAAGVRAIRQAAPRADIYELALQAGHFGLVVGSNANRVTWPTVAGWTRWRAGEGEMPDEVTPVPEEGQLTSAPEVAGRVGYGLELAGAVGTGIARSMAGTARTTAPESAHAHARSRWAASPARPSQADPAEHANLARPAGRGTDAQGA